MSKYLAFGEFLTSANLKLIVDLLGLGSNLLRLEIKLDPLFVGHVPGFGVAHVLPQTLHGFHAVGVLLEHGGRHLELCRQVKKQINYSLQKTREKKILTLVLFHQLDASLGICLGQSNARLDFQVQLDQFTLQLQEVNPFALNFVYNIRKPSKSSFNFNFTNIPIPNGFGFLAGAATVGAAAATAVGATFSTLVVEVALFLAGDGATAGSSSSPSRYRFGLIFRPLRLTTSGCGSFAGLATAAATVSSFTASSLTGAAFLGAAEGLSAAAAAAVAFLADFLLGSSLTGLAGDSLAVVAAAALLSSPFFVSSLSDFMLLSTTVELAEMRDALKLAWKDRRAKG